MTLQALTRAVSPSIEQCALTHLERQTIDVDRAGRQHRRYVELLAELGVKVIVLPPLPDCPDAVFVEDTCVVLDEVAVLGSMGCLERRPEAVGLADFLSPYRSVVTLSLPGTLDGGDVLRVDKTLYVGVAGRTNEQGCDQLRRAVERFGYQVVAMRTTGCLHLKSACTYLGQRLLLANPAWVDVRTLPGWEILETHPDEPFGANALRVGDSLIYPTAFPRTAERIHKQGFRLQPVDVSELQKAEAGVTCMSVLFETTNEP